MAISWLSIVYLLHQFSPCGKLPGKKAGELL